VVGIDAGGGRGVADKVNAGGRGTCCAVPRVCVGRAAVLALLGHGRQVLVEAERTAVNMLLHYRSEEKKKK
jgi:hypothetical protein